MPPLPPSARLEALRRKREEASGDPAVRAWVERALRRRDLLAADRHVELTLPTLGHRSLLLLARASDGRPLAAGGRPIAGVVVRFHRKLARFGRYLAAVRGVERRGLPVPALLATAAVREPRLPERWASFEELVEGRPYSLLEPAERVDAARRVGATLAAFHGHRRRFAGWLWLPRPGAAAGIVMGDVRRRLARLAPHLGGDVTAGLRRDLERAAAALGGRRAHELLHGHVFNNNFLVSAERVMVVDLGSARFGDGADDLVSACERVAGGREGEESALLAGYFDAGTGLDPEEYARQAPFYRACHLLAALVGRLRRREDGRLDPEGFGAGASLLLEQFREALGS